MGISKDSIAIPTRDSPEARDAFKNILRDLYEQYPPAMGTATPMRDPQSFLPTIAAMHRDSSLNEWKSAGSMAYYACDTGVPNELILSAYTLLFV